MIKQSAIGNEAERILAYQCRADGISIVQNYRFHEHRRFEIDIAQLDTHCGIEINGGVFTGQAHGSVRGILRDMEKRNLLIQSGWRVLVYTPAQVKNGEAIEGLKQLIWRSHERR